MPEFIVDQFHGGMTDHYVNGDINRSRYMRNVLITRNRKPRQRNGSVPFVEDSIPQGNQRISRLYYDNDTIFGDRLYLSTGRRINYVEAGSFVELLPPNPLFPIFNAGDINSVVSFDALKNKIVTTIDDYCRPRMIITDEFGNTRAQNLSLPEFSSDLTPIPQATAPGFNFSYLYAFVYRYEYKIGDVTYIDYGPVTFFPNPVRTNVPITGANPVTMSANPSIPYPGNPFLNPEEQYDFLNIQELVFRTENNGTAFKFVGQLPLAGNVDGVPDSSLGFELYTNSGVINPSEAPPCKYFTIANNIGWYANCIGKEFDEATLAPLGEVIHDYRVYHSFQGQLGQVPSDYYIDMSGPITGISNVDIYPVVFERKKTYRLEGIVDRLGRGVVNRRDISDEVGCISNAGIVRTKRGIFFPALDGFYFCDGFRVQKLSEHLNERYKRATVTDTQKRRITGGFDRITGRVYWTMISDEDKTECDSIWVLDPYWGLSVESTFTEFYEEDDDNFKPTSVAFVDGIMLRADSRGYVFQHNDLTYTDPTVDITDSVANWKDQAVRYYIETNAYSYGSEQQRKYITNLVTIFKNNSNLSVQMYSINDDKGQLRPLKEFRFRSNIAWDDDLPEWGDIDAIWYFGGLIMSKRRFPRKSLRCSYKQIAFTNSETIIAGSDSYEYGTINSATNTILLPTEKWPTDIENFYIYFDDTGYTQGFKILSRSDDTLIVDDPANLLNDGSRQWIIKGVKKNELFELESYTIEYNMFGESHNTYTKGGDGANAT